MLKRITIILLSLFAGLMIIGFSLGLYINTSDSIPKGIYRQEFDLGWNNFKYQNIKLQIGDFVAFCPPNKPIFQQAKQRHYIPAGLCAGSLGIMLKQVAAISGDTVSINQNGVLINDKLLSFSKPLAADDKQRELPQILLTKYRLQADEVLLMTDKNPNSFDARYFGVLKTAAIKHRIKIIKALD